MNKNTCKKIALSALVTLSFILSACGTGTEGIVNDHTYCNNNNNAGVLDGCPDGEVFELAEQMCSWTGGYIGNDGDCYTK
jgi:hypothetical protein